MVSIGVAFEKQLCVGVIFNPYANEMFTAVRGQGAQLNGQPLRVSGTTALNQSLVSMNFTQDRTSARLQRQLDTAARLLRAPCHGLRSTGSAAFALADVAAGRLDCFFEEALKPWDVAAGALLVQEAGGVVCRPQDGSAFDVMEGSVFACATAPLRDEILPLLQ